MFEKIKKTYFGARPVEGVTELAAENHVVVTFSDDKLPKQEKMHRSEWEDGKSEEPMDNPAKLQEWWVKRSQKRRQAVLDTLVSFNPRFADMKRDATWLAESLTIVYKDVVNKVFGLENFDEQATVDLIFTRVERDDPEFTKDWTEFQREMLALCRKHPVKVQDIMTQHLFGEIQNKIENAVSFCVSDALGGNDEVRRCSDMERLIKENTKKMEEGNT